ncbi:MAG: AAA family ATPase [Gemmatimonadetes bacterium]|nr:AAA family ATPase [Gemmatimonadota bacterium]
MRIESIRVERFGRLRSFDTGPSALPGLVVVLGPNEAGKSTLFQFLTTLLYGFHPASREGNPYAPWDGDDASGGMSLRLDAGGCVEVERRLLSSPTGRLAVDGGVEDLRNRPLPWAEHVPRAVFRQVFAVTLAELTGLDEETWARVQDRIVGSMGSTDLIPARHVAAGLEQEAGELWRPSRRGNQRIRDLREAILSLRSRRREALDRDARLRSLVEELDAARTRLQDARIQRHEERAAVERVQSLLPVRAQLRRIAALRETVGPEEELAHLPVEPAAALDEATARVRGFEEELRRLGDETKEPREVAAAFGGPEGRLLEHTEEIREFLTRFAAVGADRARLRTVEEETRGLERRLESVSGEILEAPWADVAADALLSISLSELMERISRYQTARDERRVLEAALRHDAAGASEAAHRTSLVGSLAVLLSGGALLTFGVLHGDVPATAVGSAGAAAGVVLLAVSRRGRRARRSGGGTDDPAAAKVREARGAEDVTRVRVLELLGEIPVLPTLAADPTAMLSTGVERLQELLRDLASRQRERAELEARVGEADATARTLAELLDLQAASDAEAVAHVLDQELRRAERLGEAAGAAGRELRRLERERARVEDDLAGARAARDLLHRRLEEAGAGDVERGGRELRSRIEARDRARQLQDEMERAHPDLDEIRSRIAAAEADGESWTVDDHDVARRRARYDELVEEAEELARRVEALDKDIAHLREMETVDAVDGEAASLGEEEAALVRRRDRLWVLAQLVREADRRFREEHQPDLIRRAGGYLGRLTGRRYDRIVADEAGEGDVFYILGPDLPGPVALRPPVSTGTLEQAYLALRLAIVDHLDQGTERLPLFVDEVFVNWDGRRRTRGLDLLAEIAQARQLFVFTCHPDVAEELEERGAAVVPLPWP